MPQSPLAEAHGLGPDAERDLAGGAVRERQADLADAEAAARASPATRLIGGEPMKPATNRLSGRW